MTVGEILDSAIALLRTRLVALLCTAAALASAEQVLLYFLRRAALAKPPLYLPRHPLTSWSGPLLLVTGLVTEVVVLTVLATVSATAARAVIDDTSERGSAQGRTGRSGMLGMAAVATLPIAVLTATAAMLCWIPWIWVYATVGMTGAVIAIERVGPLSAIRRSIGLSSRNGMRGGWVRLAAWIGWLAIRVAAGYGTAKLLAEVLPVDESTALLVGSVALALVNCVAYATLSCVDAINYLDVRMRTEGLDIAVGRANATSRASTTSLAGATGHDRAGGPR